MQVLESQLEGLFKGTPKLPEKSKESLVNAWPWIALVFGVLQLLVAWGLYGALRVATPLLDYATEISRAYGYNYGLSSTDKMIIYLGLIMLVVDAVILLMAYPKLKTRSKGGWDLLYLGSLVNVAYAVLALFEHGQGVGSFIFSLLGSAVGFYLLFQVKDKYKA